MEMFPVRSISNVKNKKKTGFFPSLKIGRPVAFESLLERDFLFLLEFDDDVISYLEQPKCIEYIVNKKKLKYTPDFIINRKYKTQIVEIKPEQQLNKIIKDPVKSNKFLAAHYYCQQNGYEFKIITDENIRNGNKLNNIKLMFAFSRVNVPTTESSKIINELSICERIQIDELLQRLSASKNDYTLYKQYIYSMLYNKQMFTDINKCLEDTSIVWI